MLGGYCQFSAGTTSKTFSNLQDHSEVRIKVTWHFIDDWRGETGYVEIGSSSGTTKVWGSSYDVTLCHNPINVCGDSSVGEGKFAVPIDVRYKHDTQDLVVKFGSTLDEQPCEASWGISGLEIYIR